MKVDDRVNLAEGALDLDDQFWKLRALDKNSIGTVVRNIGSSIVEIGWDNGTHSISKSCILKPFKDKNIPLPNRKFMELKQRR